MRAFLLISLLTLSAHSLFAESEKDRAARQARELLAMSQEEAGAAIQRMSSDEAAEAVSNILNQVRPRFKQADHIHYLLRHLAQIEATEREQKRLNNLLLVIFLTVALLAGFFIYILFDQRKWMAQLAKRVPDADLNQEATAPGPATRSGKSKSSNRKKSRR
ncbi:MAG: hypothetical protein K8S54_07250 [Spirochaetia bacterium]|nr:hypothetical protein [Spirochaetia bacterium]